MFRGLCLYLAVFLCFPPQVWTAAANAQPAVVAPPVAPAGLAPRVKVDTRRDLRQKFALASWKIAFLVKSKAAFLLKTHPAEFYKFLEPFADCASPFKGQPTSASDLDNTVLIPLQEFFAQYLLAHTAEISDKDVAKAGEPLDGIPLVTSPDNNVECAPSVWKPEKRIIDLEAEGAKGYLAQIESEARVYHFPFAKVLLDFTSGNLGNTELRSWLGWLLGLREFRTMMAGYYKVRDKQKDVVPAPLFSVMPTIGRKVNDVIQGERLVRLTGVNADQKEKTGLLANIPHFATCADDTTRWCFYVKADVSSDSVDDEVLMETVAPREKTLGTELNVMRKMSIKALMSQLALVNSLLPNEAVPLVNSCREASDLKEVNRFYDRLSSFDKKSNFGGLVVTAAEKLEADYRNSVLKTPVPEKPEFYNMAQKLAKDWLNEYFATHSFVTVGKLRENKTGEDADDFVGPKKPKDLAKDPNEPKKDAPPVAKDAPKGDPKADPKVEPKVEPQVDLAAEAVKKVNERQKALFSELEAVTFKNRLMEAPGRATSDFSLLLGEKVLLWGALVQEEIALIPPARQKAEVAILLEGLVNAVLLEALQAYGMSFAHHAGLELKAMGEVWNTSIKGQWEFALKSDVLKGIIPEIAKAVANGLFERFPEKETIDPVKQADQSLTNYVRTIAPRVKEALQAEDTSLYLQKLIEWKNNPLYNLVPNPWNYHWKLSQSACVGDTPAYFFVDDGSGHGYGYTLPPPNVMDGEGYLHIIPALKGVTEKRRDDLIKRLDKRGYTDEMTRRMFTTQGARNTGVMADLVAKKFHEILEAKPKRDRNWSASERTASLLPLLKWIKRADARLYYETAAGVYAHHLYHFQLRRFFEATLSVTPGLENELKQIYQNDTMLRHAKADELLELVKKTGAGVQGNASLEKIVADLQAITKGLAGTDAFESAVDFKKSLALPNSPLKTLMETGQKFFINEPALKELFNARFQGATEHYVDDFLLTFGRTGTRYDGTPPGDPIKATQLANLELALVNKAWASLSTDAKVKEKALGQIRAMLKNVSSLSFDKGENAESILTGLNAEITKLSAEWFEVWANDLDALVIKVGTLLKEKETPELFKAFTTVYGTEPLTLTLYKPLNIKERIFQKELAGVLLPNFSEYREALTKRIEKVLASKADPETVIAEKEVERRALSDARWSLLKDKNEAEQKAALETSQGKEIEKQLNWVLKFQKDAMEDQKARVELRRLVRNYLPDLGEAKIMLAADVEAKGSEALWSTYVSDQFYESKLDAAGQPTELSPADVVEDLNFIAAGAERKLFYDGEKAKAYLKGIGKYFSAALDPKHLPNVTRWYEEAIGKAGRESLKGFSLGIVPITLGSWKSLEARQFGSYLSVLRKRAAITITPEDKAKWEQDAVVAYPLGDNLKTVLLRQVPKADVYLGALAKEATRLAAEVEKGPLSDAELTNYWGLVEEVSHLAFARNFEMPPLDTKSDDGKTEKVASLNHLPSSEIPAEFTSISTSATHPIIHTTILLRAAGVAALNKAWPEIFSAAKGKTFETVEARRAWVLALSNADRATATKEWKAYVDSALNKTIKVQPLQPLEQPTLGYEEWVNSMDLHVGLWQKYQIEHLQKGTLFLKDPRFPELARAIFRLFIEYLPYRLVDGTLKFQANPEAVRNSYMAWSEVVPEKQLDIVTGIYERFGLENGRQVVKSVLKKKADIKLAQALEWDLSKLPEVKIGTPFEAPFRSVQKLPGTTWMVSPDEQWIRLASEQNTDFVSPEVLLWQAFATSRLNYGNAVTTSKVGGFTLNYAMPGTSEEDGSPRVTGTQSESFAAWVKTWSTANQATLAFEMMAKTPQTSDRKQLWHKYGSLDALLKSGIIEQVKGTLVLVDNIAKHPFVPGTYGYFLALLNWNISNGVEPPVGPTAYPLPPHPRLLGKLLEELVLSIGLDLRTINGWQKSLQRYGGPEEWLAIAESRRSLLVGVADRRFLGRPVDAHYVNNPNSVGATMGYRPFPIVDDTERSQLGTSRKYHDWARRTESPAMIQQYRANVDDRSIRPRFEQIASVQGEMIGEKDVQDGNPLARERFKTQKGKWAGKQFGAADFDAGRLAEIQKRLELRGVKIVKEELTGTLSVRDALVDLRRTLSELNLRYAHEQWRYLQGRGNDVPDSITGIRYTEEVSALLKAFAKQMDEPNAELPDLTIGDGYTDGKFLAEGRRLLIGKAIYWASQLARKRAFKDKKVEVVTVILEVADQFYNEEGMKIETRRSLKAAAANFNKSLDFACKATDVVNITNEKEFKAARKTLLEDTGLAMMDNLQQVMYFDSGWMKDGENSDARRMLQQMAREASDDKKNAKTIEKFVFYTALITLTIVFMGRSNPGATRVLLGSRAAQGLLTFVSYAAALGFAGLEAYQVYQDYWGLPDEVAALNRVADSQFLSQLPVGHFPLMKDETAGLIPGAYRKLQTDQRSLLRWTFHIWGALAGIQAMSPIVKWVWRTPARIYGWVNPKWPVHQRFKGYLSSLGLGKSKTPFEAVEALSKTEASERALSALHKLLGGTRGPNGTIVLDAAAADLLSRDAKLQYEALCKQLGLNPRTLLPWAESETAHMAVRLTVQDSRTFWQRAREGFRAPTDTRSLGQRLGDGLKSFYNGATTWGTYNPYNWGRAAQRLEARTMGEAQAAARGRLEFLRNLIERLKTPSPAVEATDIVGLLGVEADPVLRHTPLWMSFFGISKFGLFSPTIASLRRLRLVARANLDIITLHDPEVLATLTYFTNLSLNGGVKVEKWEIFTKRFGQKLYDLPPSVRRFFNALKKDAMKLTDAEFKGREADFESALDMEMARLKFFTRCFEETLGGTTVAERQLLVEKYEGLISTAFKGYTPRQANHFKDVYLNEIGMQLKPEVLGHIKFVNNVASWKNRSDEALRRFCSEKSISEDEALTWMLDPRNGKYSSFRRPDGFVQPAAEDVIVGEVIPTSDIHTVAFELRGLMAQGGYFPNRQMVKAIASGDYSVMAWFLTKMGKQEIDANAHLEGTDLDPDARPIGREPAPQANQGPAPVFEPRKPIEVKSSGELRAEADAELDAVVKKAVALAEEKAVAANFPPARVAQIKANVEARSRALAKAKREELESRILRFEDKYKTERGQYDTLYVQAREGFTDTLKRLGRELEHSIVGEAVISAEAEALAAILAQRTPGIFYDKQLMIDMIVESKTIPQDLQKAVIDLLGRRGNTRALQRELGHLRRYGKLTIDQERTYRLASAYNRAMEVADGLPATADRQSLMKILLEQHFAHIERVAEAPMSLAESTELLGLHSGGRYPTTAEIEAAAVATKQMGVSPKHVDLAVANLKKADPATRDLGDLDTLALILNVPAEALPSQVFTNAIIKSRQTLMSASEGNTEALATLQRRYGEGFEETVDDGLRFLAMQGTPAEAAVKARARKIVEQSERLAQAAEASGDLAANLMHKEAARRAARAEWLVLNRTQVGVRQKVEGKAELKAPAEVHDIDFSKDPFFAEHSAKYDAKLVAKAKECTLGECRSAFIEAMAKGGEVELSGLDSMEELMRLMHLTYVVNDLRAAGRFTHKDAFDHFVRIAMEQYVKNNKLGFTFMMPGESEAFVLGTLKNFGEVGRLDFTNPVHLRELNKMAADQRAKLALGTANLSELHIHKFTEALMDISMRHVAKARGAADRVGLEAMALHSRLGMPEEVIMALAYQMEKQPTYAKELEAIIQYLTYGPRAGFRGSNGGNSYGDLKVALYGPDGAKLPAINDALKQTLLDEMNIRYMLAIKGNSDWQKEMIERAAKRLNGIGAEGEAAKPAGDELSQLLDSIVGSKFEAVPPPR